MRGKLWQKLALVALVPMVLELALVPPLINVFNNLENQAHEQSRIQIVNEQARSLSVELSQFSAALSVYVLTRQPLYSERAAQLAKDVSAHAEELGTLAGLRNNRSTDVDRLRAKIRQTDMMLTEIMKDVESGVDNQAFARANIFKRIHALQFSVLSDLEVLISKQKADLIKVTETSETLRHQLEKFVLIGVGIQTSLALLFVLSYSSQLKRRFGTVVSNAIALVTDRPLKQMLKGTDEIAALDQTLHSVASILQINKRKERAMIDNAVDLICSIDRDCRFIDVSASCESILEYKPSELIGSRVVALVEDDQQSLISSLAAARASGESFKTEARLRTMSGKKIDVQWAGTFSAEEDAVFCIVHDVTERKQLDRFKQEFLSMITHDLRSPLTAVIISIELIESGSCGELNERGFRVIGRMTRTVKRIVSMINDLLDVERFESGTFDLARQDAAFETIVTPALDALIPISEQNGVRFEVKGSDLVLNCDTERIQRVIANLASNALKYAPRSSKITVQASLVDGCSQIEVIDQGPGVPESSRALIFERFKQVSRDDEKLRGGLGLGLPICRAIVHAHGGNIGVRDAPGGGSIFWFRLPQAEPMQLVSDPAKRIHTPD